MRQQWCFSPPEAAWEASSTGSISVVSFPDPAPLRGKEGLGTLVDFLGILCVSNHVTHAYAHAHFSNKRVIRELRIVSCPGGGVWVAVTREFERDNCVISEILQSDWTIPNRAGVPRKSTKVPRPSFRVWAGRSGHETSISEGHRGVAWRACSKWVGLDYCACATSRELPCHPRRACARVTACVCLCVRLLPL